MIHDFASRVLSGRWFSVFASLLIMSVNGTSYMFGLYSGEIKSSLGYDQTTLNTLSFFKDLGGNLGVSAGLLFEVTPSWAVLSIGALMNFLAYFLIWVAVTGRIAEPYIWQMCLNICLATNAASYPNIAALVTSVRNFPESRGIVIGLLKGLIGLSGAILTQIYHALYGNDTKSLILLIAWFPFVVSLAFLRIIRIRAKAVFRQVEEIRVFYRFLYVALSIAGFIMIFIIIQNKLQFTRLEYIGSASIVLLLLFLPLGFVVKEELNQGRNQDKFHESNEAATTIARGAEAVITVAGDAEVTYSRSRTSTSVTSPKDDPDGLEVNNTLTNVTCLKGIARGLEVNGTPSTPVASIPELNFHQNQQQSALNNLSESNITTNQINPSNCFRNIFNHPKRGEDYTILQAIFSIDMLIILISTTCGVGGALAAIDNLGQIADSFGYKNHNISTFISLISIWNFLGRVLAGFASEIFLTNYKFPRPLVLTIIMLISCFGHILIAFGAPNSLYISSIILGFCLGAQLPLVSAIISEIFGLKHFSTLYSVGSISSPIGSYFFNVKVVGYFYDKEALKQMEELGLRREIGKELGCNGIKCFRVGFGIIALASFLGFLVSIILVCRTRNFYRNYMYSRWKI